jgi:hypothetical protein
LFDALVVEGARRGLSVQATSVAVFANKARIYSLRDRETCRRVTAEKIRAWIDKGGEAAVPSPPPVPVVVLPAGKKSRPYCRQPKDCPAPPRGPCRICHAKPAPPAPQPPERRVPLGDRRFRENRVPPAPWQPPRDPTLRPETPLMDAAERQKIAGQRHACNIKRAQEREAAERLDAGKGPRNAFERTTMAHIEQRRDAEARAADPVEQAKLALQRKGRVVHSATIHGGRRGFFMVGGQRDPRTGRLREISPGELLDLAEKVTGQSFRRVG